MSPVVRGGVAAGHECAQGSLELGSVREPPASSEPPLMSSMIACGAPSAMSAWRSRSPRMFPDLAQETVLQDLLVGTKRTGVLNLQLRCTVSPD